MSILDEEVQRLCRAIPEEKDAEKMMALVQQLNRLLDAQEAGRTTPLPVQTCDLAGSHRPELDLGSKKSA